MTQENDTESFEPAPPGWVMRSYMETFSGRAGPFYFREPGAEPGVGFYSKPHHGNLGGVIHGGMLMTLADMSLFDVCFRSVGETFKAVTVTLNSEFLNPGPIGAFVTATGEITKAGRRFNFVRGMISAEEKQIMAFSGSLMRLP